MSNQVFLPIIHHDLISLRQAFASQQMSSGMAGEGTSFASSVQKPLILKHADIVTAEVSMKMGITQALFDAWDFSYSDELIKSCFAYNIDVFGHCLLWHIQQPEWLWPTLDGLNITERYNLLKKHIETSMEHYRWLCVGMDVVNEYGAVGEYLGWGYYLGPECVEYAFRVARECNTGMGLYYNSFFDTKADVDLAMQTLQWGDGIGVQLHTSTIADNSLKFDWIREMAKECKRLNKKMRFSEISVCKKIDEPMENVARVYRDIVRLAKEYKGTIINFTTWGVKGTSWNGGYLLFDSQGKPLPQYYAVIDELFRN